LSIEGITLEKRFYFAKCTTFCGLLVDEDIVFDTVFIRTSKEALWHKRNLKQSIYGWNTTSRVPEVGCLRLITSISRLTKTGGQLIIDGQPVTGPGTDRGMVFQDSCLMPWRTVFKNVIFGLECQGLDNSEGKERAQKFIKLVGLAGFEDHYPHELSGGMQQRCNLARALTVDPQILIMDEPFAALDAQTREIMQSELLRIWRESGKTVLFITHQINEAIYLADRVIVFGARPGRVKEMMKIDIPRPRPLSVKRDKRFLEYEDHLWTMIEEEVKKTMVQDQVVHNIDA
jgi:NitT/TauT family transport system ATP-binding protein